jgi:double-stranded uracil-DNA glycosylase
VAKYKPDVLAHGLDVIFCGLNPASSAVAVGHNFSHPSNRFWSVLELAGFTKTRLQPHEEQQLPDYGCGITAVVQRASQRAQDVSTQEILAARPDFETKIRRLAPRAVAFLGKRACSVMPKPGDAGWGRRSEPLGGAIVWVLPNPSGLNRRFTLAQLVRAYTELRTALASQ